MSHRQYRSQNYQLNNAPVQQQIYSHQMPYNDYYHVNTQANENNIYSRSMATYGNDTTANNGYAAANSTNTRRYFNPNAAVFEPRGYVQQQQPVTSPLTNYSNPYPTSYMQQPVSGQVHAQQQPIRSIQPQQHCMYPTPQQPNILPQSHSPIQQLHQPSKYQQYPVPQLPAYAMNDPLAAAPYQNGVADYQQIGQKDPGFNAQFNQFPLSNDLLNSIQNSNNRMAIIEVQIGLEQLVTEPSEFDLWANAIKARVSSGINNDDSVLIAWLIVEMSYMGTNAQYGFSRLCKMLDSEIKAFTIQYVIPRIAHFVGSNGVGSLSSEHLSNFITFLAELYDKTEVNNGIRIAHLGKYIIDHILLQLNSGEKLNDQIVKNIVQVLKLTGRYLEEDQDPERLKQVFQKLDSLQKGCPDISSAVKNNIRQLNLLRERNWGIVASDDGGFMNGSSSMSNSYYQSSGQNDGVMYGPDGQPISEEERLFLEESCRAVEPYSEMDADTYADYENFLQEQTEETANMVAARALERLSIDEDSSPQRKNLPV